MPPRDTDDTDGRVSPPIPRCDECGFDPEGLTAEAVPGRLLSSTAAIGDRLTTRQPDALRRPAAGLAWSALEYGAHVRDVLDLFDRRVRHILAEDAPVLEVVDHDALVVAGRYDRLDPREVAGQVAESANRFVATLGTVPAGAWLRHGTRAGERRTILETAFRAVHESHHHLYDIERLLAATEPGRDRGSLPGRRSR